MALPPAVLRARERELLSAAPPNKPRRQADWEEGWIRGQRTKRRAAAAKRPRFRKLNPYRQWLKCQRYEESSSFHPPEKESQESVDLLSDSRRLCCHITRIPSSA